MTGALKVGETRGSEASSRKLVVHGTLPEYETPATRIANLDSDIRDMTNRMRRDLTDKASEYHVRGFVLDEESWELAANGHTLVLTVTINRP